MSVATAQVQANTDFSSLLRIEQRQMSFAIDLSSNGPW
jgi:hypothetical protein